MGTAQSTSDAWAQYIHHLTAATFEKALRENSSLLVMLYAPYSENLNELQTMFSEAGKQMKHENIHGVLSAVDTTTEFLLAQQLHIKHHPSYKYFVNGSFKFDVMFENAQQIVDFMKGQKVVVVEDNERKLLVFKQPTEPQPLTCMHWDNQQCCVVHLSHTNIESLLNDQQMCLVLFYNTPCYNICKTTFDEFVKASENLKNETKFVLAAINCTMYDTARLQYKIENYPTLKLFSKGVEKLYTGENTAADFAEFLHNEVASKTVAKAPSSKFGPFPGADKVQMLYANTYEQLLTTKTRWLIFFYTQWCGFCTQMKPEYAAAAERLEREHVPCKLAAVDCTDDYEIADAFYITMFPTLKFVDRNSLEKDYRGARTSNAIVDFLKVMCADKTSEK